MSRPPHASRVALPGGASHMLDTTVDTLNRLGRDRVEKLLEYHGWEGPVPGSGQRISRADAAHIALLLLRQHLPRADP